MKRKVKTNALFVILIFLVFSVLFSFYSKPVSNLCNRLLLSVNEVTVQKKAPPKEKKQTAKEPVKISDGAISKNLAPSSSFRKFSDQDGTTVPVLKQTNGNPKEIHKSFLRTFTVMTPSKDSLNGKAFTTKNALDVEFFPEEKNLRPQNEQNWIAGTSTQINGKFDFKHVFPGKNLDNSVLYAVVDLELNQDYPKAKLLIGNDDQINVFLNGESVFKYSAGRGTKIDGDIRTVALKKGLNHLVIKAVNFGGGWDMALRLTDENKTPLFFQ